MDHGSAAGDDLVLVPVVDLDVAAKGAAIADGADEPRTGARGGVHHFAAPGNDPEGRVLGIELAGVGGVQGIDREPEIRLRPGHHPIEIALFAGVKRLGPGQSGLAAVLDATAARDLALDLKLEVEILRHQILAPDIRVVDNIVFAGFADNGAVFDAPECGIALPIGKALAVEDLGKAGVVIEIHGGRFMKL